MVKVWVVHCCRATHYWFEADWRSLRAGFVLTSCITQFVHSDVAFNSWIMMILRTTFTFWKQKRRAKVSQGSRRDWGFAILTSQNLEPQMFEWIDFLYSSSSEQFPSHRTWSVFLWYSQCFLILSHDYSQNLDFVASLPCLRHARRMSLRATVTNSLKAGKLARETLGDVLWLAKILRLNAKPIWMHLRLSELLP